jgi:DNA (cytosine-5)-methyltransferase 1
LERHAGHGDDGQESRRERPQAGGSIAAASGLVVHRAWSEFSIVYDRNGKARRLKPGIVPLVDGIPGRVGLLRGYGNAIVPALAAEFLKTFLEAEAAFGIELNG